MPALFRPWIIDYIDAEGRRVPPSTPGAVKRKQRSTKWYTQGLPGLPPRKRVPLATDKATARRMLDDLVRDAERGAASMPKANAGKVPLLEYLTEFEKEMGLGLASRNRRRIPSPAQVSLTAQRIRDVLGGCDFTMPADFGRDAPAKLSAYLSKRMAIPRQKGLRATKMADGTGQVHLYLSPQTAVFLVKAMKRFAWWLSTRKGAPINPAAFDAVTLPNPKTNRVHARRPATPAEVEKLLATVRLSKVVYRELDGVDRFHLWTLAFATGFRAGELAKLTPAHFRLDASPPVVMLAANETKSGRADRQPIPDAVAVLFRAYLQGRPEAKPVWPGTWHEKPVKMLRGDLEEAGIPYVIDTPEGKRFLDAHSLRHTYVTSLAGAGIGVKELQTLARHADAQTTLNVYTHTTADALTDSVSRVIIPGVTGGVTTLADMPRVHLEALAAGLIALTTGVIFPTAASSPLAPPLAPDSRTLGDAGGRTRTGTGEEGDSGTRRKRRESRQK